MPASKQWSNEDFRTVAEMRQQGYEWDSIGDRLGASGNAARKAFAHWHRHRACPKPTAQPSLPQAERVYRENRDKSEATLELTTSRPVKTLGDAIRVAEVDLSVWEIHTWECRQWTTPMKLDGGQQPIRLKKAVQKDGQWVEVEEDRLQWQPAKPAQQQQYLVSLKLRRKTPEVLSIESLLQEIAKGKGIKLPVYKRKPAKATRRALEISIMDPHLGLRCFQPSADHAWSTEMAQEAFMATVERLLEQAKVFGPFEEIVAPIGNDYFHADNLHHSTTKGTPQPETDALKEVVVTGEKLMLWLTDRLRREAPVKMLGVSGNHANLVEFLMARLVRAYYLGAGATDVSVDASSSPYKFWAYGVNLIGFEHGNNIQPHRLAALMANETRLNHWRDARYCEWHLGDQHRKGSGKPVTFEEQGVSVEYLPSLTPANEWHRDKAYNWQKRGGMAFVYDYDAGPVARLQCNFDSYTGKHLGEKVP